MNKNTGFLQSLKNALSGFFYAVKNERNLRFHLCVANLICIFAYFFKLSRTEWAILFIAILSVVSAELFNTAIEHAVDTATDKICDTAKNAKDVSAAAPCFCAVCAVIIGIMLFGDLKKIKTTLKLIFVFSFSGIPEFLIMLLILIFNIWLLFFCGQKKG